MYQGAQLVAANGFRNLSKGTTYYFVRSQVSGVTLLSFHEHVAKKKKASGKDGRYRAFARTYRALLTRLPRDDFEDGLRGQISMSESQSCLPPWLEDATLVTVPTLDKKGYERWERHKQLIDRRIEAISGLLEQREKILVDPHPEKIIRAYARKLGKNESRIALWFWTFFVFGTRESLHYATKNLGKWDRDKPGAKRGRSSNEGYNVDSEMKESMFSGYEHAMGEGRTLMEVYADVLRINFGCKKREEGKDRQVTYHPDGKPFPSYDQFVYHVKKHFGSREVAVDKHTEKVVSETWSYSQGPYTAGASNLFEQVQSDAYVCMDLPMSFISRNLLPALRVSTEIDVASGEILGVGFSLGSETGRIYRSAQFCSAISKSIFGKIIGMEISETDWPAVGVGPFRNLDRGPGTAKTASPAEYVWGIKSLMPSGRPKSKAAVEGSNPKSVDLGSQPTYRTSGKTVHELIKSEVARLIQRNKTADVFKHVPPEMLHELEVATPNSLYRALERRGRNQATRISFDQAVRTFLEPVEAQIRDDGLYVGVSRYSNPEFQAHVLSALRSDRRAVKTHVYMYECAIRYVWYDLNGTLLWLEMQVPLQAGDRQKYLTEAEAIELAATASKNRSSAKKSRTAARIGEGERQAAESGRPLNFPRVVHGRPKNKTKTAKQEATQTVNHLRGRG